MKILSPCFYIILTTWKIVNCEGGDSVLDVGFPKYTEDTEFVNPHSFDYDRNSKKMRDRQLVKISQSSGVCVSDDICRRELKQCREACDTIEFNKLYITRLINLLISSAKLKEEDDRLTGSITLSGTKADIEQLRGFKDGKITIQQVDVILSDIITPSTNIFGEALTFIDRVRLHIYQHGRTYAFILAIVGILLFIKYVNWSFGKGVIAFLVIVFLVSFVTIWSQLIKEAELKQLVAGLKHKKPPIQCEPEKMTFWNRIVTFFDTDDKCYEYYKAIEFDAFYEVTLIDAFVEVFDRLLLKPATRTGSVIDGFIKNSTKSLSFPVSWIVTILLYLGFVAAFPFLILVVFGSRIRLWFGPFFGISIGGEDKNKSERRQPALAEQRTPIIHISPTILERGSDGELRQLVPSAITHTTNNSTSAIGAGDSQTQSQVARIENSDAICSSCCCKNSSSRTHVQQDVNLGKKPIENEVRSKDSGDKPTKSEDRSKDPGNKTTKSEVRSEEKGDGDC